MNSSSSSSRRLRCRRSLGKSRKGRKLKGKGWLVGRRSRRSSSRVLMVMLKMVHVLMMVGRVVVECRVLKVCGVLGGMYICEVDEVVW